GNSRCLEAFKIALNQACGDGEKACYVSTMDLQLASLSFCRACRAVPTLHVRLGRGTPRSMWALQTPQEQPTTDCAEPGAPNRLPVVHMLSATWDIATIKSLVRSLYTGE
ncbi:unnamed protein product, partial [Laminaria digitata]